MKKIIPVVILLATIVVNAQETPVTPYPYGWKHSLVAGLTLTQVAFTDWVQGGENALAYTLSVDGKSVNDELTSNWINAYKLAFGQTRLGNQGLRKTDDNIDLSSVFTYKLGTYVNPYVSASLKTQIAKGFAYGAGGIEVQLSQFFDPAYLTQSIGVGYQPIKEVKTRLGLAFREVITNQFNQYTDDPATVEIEKTTIDGGLESVTNIEWQLEENILLKEDLELFAPMKRLDEIVARSSTTITGKVNKYISAIFSLNLINEKRVSPKTQVKESISLGLSYTLF